MTANFSILYTTQNQILRFLTTYLIIGLETFSVRVEILRRQSVVLISPPRFTLNIINTFKMSDLSGINMLGVLGVRSLTSSDRHSTKTTGSDSVIVSAIDIE